MNYKIIMLTLLVTFIFYLFYNTTRFENIESMSNYKLDNEHFYLNNFNIQNKIANDEISDKWAQPYIDFSPCDYGYFISPTIKL